MRILTCTRLVAMAVCSNLSWKFCRLPHKVRDAACQAVVRLRVGNVRQDTSEREHFSPWPCLRLQWRLLQGRLRLCSKGLLRLEGPPHAQRPRPGLRSGSALPLTRPTSRMFYMFQRLWLDVLAATHSAIQHLPTSAPAWTATPLRTTRCLASAKRSDNFVSGLIYAWFPKNVTTFGLSCWYGSNIFGPKFSA